MRQHETLREMDDDMSADAPDEYAFLGADRDRGWQVSGAGEIVPAHRNEYMEESFAGSLAEARDRAAELAQRWQMDVRIKEHNPRGEVAYVEYHLPAERYTPAFSLAYAAWKEAGGAMTVSDDHGNLAWAYGDSRFVEEVTSGTTARVETERALAAGGLDDDEIEAELDDWQD